MALASSSLARSRWWDAIMWQMSLRRFAIASFSQVAFGCDRGLVKSDVNEGLMKVGKWPDSALREKYLSLFSWNFFEHSCLARLLTKVWGGGRGRVSKRAYGGWSSGELIGNVGTGRGAVGVGAELEWVCTEVGKVGVEVRGADRMDKVAVGVVKRGCGQGPGQWKALRVFLE